MSIKKTYIPAKPRSSKLVGTSMSGGVAGSVSSSSTGSTDPNSHSHLNKRILDTITQEMLDNALREILGVESTEEITDENYFSALRTLKEILDNNEALKDLFLSKTSNDTAQGFIQFLQGISVEELATLTQGLEIGDYTSGLLGGGGAFKMNNGISELEVDKLTARVIATLTQGLEVGDYTSGLLGSGASLKMNNGISELEVDKLTVRMIATFFEIVVSKLRHINGGLVLSRGSMTCSRVVEDADSYQCFFERGENNEISNTFVVNDQARCQVFNSGNQKFYWRLVTAVGDDWIKLSKTVGIGDSIPTAGDDIVQLGYQGTDLDHVKRLNAQIIDESGISQYVEIDSFTLEGKRRNFMSADGSGSQFTGKVSFVNADVEYDLSDWAFQVEETIDGIEIGGRNLLLDYEHIKFSGHQGQTITYVNDGDYKDIMKIVNPSYYANIALANIITPHETSDKYILSIFARGIGKLRIYTSSGTFAPIVDTTMSETTYNRYDILIPTLNALHLNTSGTSLAYVAKMQLMRGNKPMDWTPAPEDVQSEIDKAQADANTSLAKTKFMTEIDGGLIYSAMMKLYDAGDTGDEMAGVSGIAGVDKNLPAFWAGGTYQDAIGNTAKAIIRHDGSSKFTETEIEGKITVIEGFLANWTIQGNTIISKDGSVEIDSKTNTISLVNPSGGRIVIKNSVIPDILMLFPANLPSEESLAYLNHGYMDDTRTSHIVVSVPDNAISELIISSYKIVHMMFEELESEIYMDSHIYIDLLHEDVFSRRLAEDRHRIFLHDDDEKNYTKTINVPSTRIPIYESGTWSIRVTHTKTTESGVIDGPWFASATISGMGTIKAETVINRTEIGSNGMVVASSPENYTYDAGDLFQVRRGKYGLQVTDDGVKVCDTMDSVVNDWYRVKLVTP